MSARARKFTNPGILRPSLSLFGRLLYWSLDEEEQRKSRRRRRWKGRRRRRRRRRCQRFWLRSAAAPDFGHHEKELVVGRADRQWTDVVRWANQQTDINCAVAVLLENLLREKKKKKTGISRVVTDRWVRNGGRMYGVAKDFLLAESQVSISSRCALRKRKFFGQRGQSAMQIADDDNRLRGLACSLVVTSFPFILRWWISGRDRHRRLAFLLLLFLRDCWAAGPNIFWRRRPSPCRPQDWFGIHQRTQKRWTPFITLRGGGGGGSNTTLQCQRRK